MKSRVVTKIFTCLVLITISSSCVTKTRVTFVTNVDGAEVYVDGQMIGETPVQVSLSNGVWEEPEVIIKSKGFKDLYTDVKKEIKPVNLIVGLMIWWPSLLWCYGPKSNQNYLLTPIN